MMTYHINHKTIYSYSNSVSLCHNLAHLTARVCPWQTCVRSELQVSANTAFTSKRTDYFGNIETFFTIQEPHRKLEVTAINEVQVHPRPIPEPGATMPWDEVVPTLETSRSAEVLEAHHYLYDSEFAKRDPALAGYAAPSFPAGRSLFAAVMDLTERINTEFVFDSSTADPEMSLLGLLEIRRGVCQDFAHLQVGCLRSLGLAARYVSGYLLTNPPSGESRLVGADMSHAWVSVYFPGSGWIDFDPTNALVVQQRHITLAWGRDFDDVSPMKGVILGGGRHSLAVSVDVTAVPSTSQPDASEDPMAVGTSESPSHSAAGLAEDPSRRNRNRPS
jgi:transglutaminase-like putative cysteine protease